MKTKRSKACDISQKVKFQVFLRDNGQCVVCHNRNNVMPNAHFIPRSQGGLGIEENIVFLPIKGVGDIKCPNIKEKQRKIVKELLKIKKHDPILLVDSDRAGQSMKSLNNADSELQVISLNEIDSSFKMIENLFTPEDREKIGILEKNGKFIKSSPNSALFKTFVNDYGISEKTKENFNKVFKYIINL